MTRCHQIELQLSQCMPTHTTQIHATVTLAIWKDPIQNFIFYEFVILEFLRIEIFSLKENKSL